MKIFIPEHASKLLKQVADTLAQQELLLTEQEKKQNPFWARAIRQVVETYTANGEAPKTYSFSQVTNGYTLKVNHETVSFLMEKEVCCE